MLLILVFWEEADDCKSAILTTWLLTVFVKLLIESVWPWTVICKSRTSVCKLLTLVLIKEILPLILAISLLMLSICPWLAIPDKLLPSP